MKADLIFTVDLEPREIKALEYASKGLADGEIANRMTISKAALIGIFSQLWLQVNLGTAAHEGQMTIKKLPQPEAPAK